MFSQASVILFTVGEHAWQRGMRGEGACVAGETAIAAGGTHPTGMHSCFQNIKIYIVPFQSSCKSRRIQLGI